MHRLSRYRPSPAMIVAIVALVLSLGGTSYAAITLPAASVGTKQLKSNAVVGSKFKTGSLTIGDISSASLSRLSRVAYATGPNVWVPSMSQAAVATASLKVPKAGFVLVEGWACMNGGGTGVCQAWVVDETAGTSSIYNAVQVAAGTEQGCSVSKVFPAPAAGERSYSIMVLSTAGATAWGAVNAVFIPYNGDGSPTP